MKSKLLNLAAATILTFSAFLTNSGIAQATVDPLNCTGYPEARTFLEVQSWWTDPGQSEPSHLHAGTCFPVARNMTGTSTFDVRIMMHNNPGTLFAISFDFYSGYTQYINIPDVNCGLGNNCTYWYTITVNWNDVPAGWRELRLKPRVSFPPCGPSPCDEDPGATQITSTGWPIQVRDGTTGTRSECNNPSNDCQLQFRGWYEHRGYGNIAVMQARDFATQPTWTGTTHSERVKFYNNLGNGEDTQLTSASCRVDADFHNPLYVDNPFYTYTFPVGGKAKTVTLSVPLTGLANGTHHLVCITESNQPSDPTPGVLDGVMSVPFTVSN